MLTLPRFYYDTLSLSYTGHQHGTPTNEPTKTRQCPSQIVIDKWHEMPNKGPLWF
jgi:hypothetical protein